MIDSLILSERDLNVLNFINKNGFASLSAISNLSFFNLQKPSSYAQRRLAVLKKGGLVETTRFGARRRNLYLLTKEGQAELVERGFEAIGRIGKWQLANVNHDLVVQDVCARVIQQQEDIFDLFMPEREIMAKHKDDHYPDAAFFLSNHQKIALEVEIVQKNEQRLFSKLNHYEDDPTYAHVYYLCGNQNIKRKLDAYVKRGKFTAFTLKDFDKDKNLIPSKIFSHIREIEGVIH